MRRKVLPGLNPATCGTIIVIMTAIIIILSNRGYLWGLNPQKKIDQYILNQWEMAEGLLVSTVLSINQTQDGYLWIGTSKGLARFDGVNFQVYRFSEREEISSQEIRSLCVDKKGILWIGRNKGLASFNYRTGEFKIFSEKDGISDNDIRHITGDKRGNTWIGFTSSYVSRYSGGKFTHFDSSHGLSGKKINSIIEDSKGHLLFGSRENGIFIFKQERFDKYLIRGLENVLINKLFEDSRGDFWIGTFTGLYRVNGEGTAIPTGGEDLTDTIISSIIEDSDRSLWIGTSTGLNRLIKNSDGSFSSEKILGSMIVSCLFEDKEKSTWIGTDGKGLKRLKERIFRPFAPLKDRKGETPSALFESHDGDTWISLQGGKLLRFRGDRLIETVSPPKLSGTGIVAIAEDFTGNLWLGTNGKGIFQKKNGDFKQYTDKNGLADNTVTSIFNDSKNNLWFCTFDGVSVLRSNSDKLETFKVDDGLSGKIIHNVYEDKRHNIWIAGDSGITFLKNGEFKKETMEKFFEGISIPCIYEDAASPGGLPGVSWIATEGKGLKKFKDGKYVSFTTAEGLDSNFLYQFFEDSQGNFWLMSDSGILRVKKKQLEQFNRETDRIQCASYGISDGMESLEFEYKFSRNSALKSKNGEFLFITKNGISCLNPGTIRFNRVPPGIVIEKVFFNRRLFLPAKTIKPFALKGIAEAEFRFNAPTFLSTGKVKFKYRLKGLETVWKYLSPAQERTVIYRDLPPGKYSFEVTACNSEGVWNPGGASFSFTLKQFFYKTFLFKLIMLILVAALLAAALYFYKKHSSRKKIKYKDTPLNCEFAEKCIEKLKGMMENEKVYVDAEISLQTLAEKMAITPHQLSQLLNEKLNRNFADYINNYRIEEAKRILKSPKGTLQKIDTLAYEVGFNTTVAFYRAFRKFTGTTPTQYRKEAGMEK